MTDSVLIQREHGAHGRTTGSIALDLFVATFGQPTPDQYIEWEGATWHVIASFRHEHIPLPSLAPHSARAGV